jgi:hypothetical protein
MIFSEDAEGIRLEYNQVHAPFSISIISLIYVCHMALFFQMVYHLQMQAELGL